MPRESAKIVKDFIVLNSTAVLSTHSKSCPGYPFGSVVPYDVTAAGRPVLFISRISEHYRNLSADRRASLLISDRHGSADPQPYARATVLLDFHEVPEPELEHVQASYWKRFPHAPSRGLAHDFVFFVGSPKRIRWIGGFGDIRWVEADSFLEAEFDAVSYLGSGICDHMNEDHRDALVEFVKAQHGVSTIPSACTMIGVTSNSLTVMVDAGGTQNAYSVRYPRKAHDPADVRSIMIEMLGAIRSQTS